MKAGTVVFNKSQMKQIVKLPIGDWSQDGHSRYDILYFEVNKPISEIRQAYKDSCKLTGLQLHAGGKKENYTSLPEQDVYHNPLQICTEVEDFIPSEEAIKILERHNINFVLNEYRKLNIDSFSELFMKFCKLSLPDFEWKRIDKDIEPIVGFWNPELNISIGTGLYYL